MTMAANMNASVRHVPTGDHEGIPWFALPATLDLYHARRSSATACARSLTPCSIVTASSVA